MADHTPESASYSSSFLLAKDWSIKLPFTVPRMCWIWDLNWRYLQQDMPGLLIYAQVLSNPISGYPSKCSKYQLIVSKMALRTSISGIWSVPDHPFPDFPAFLGGATLIPPKITFMMSRFMASFVGAMDRWTDDHWIDSGSINIPSGYLPIW